MSDPKSATPQWVGVTVGNPETDEPAGRVQVEAALVLGGLAATWLHTTMDPKAWTVTHVESGRRAFHRQVSRDEAVAVVRALQGVTDWTRPQVDLLKIKGLGQRTEKAIAKTLADLGAETL